MEACKNSAKSLFGSKLWLQGRWVLGGHLQPGGGCVQSLWGGQLHPSAFREPLTPVKLLTPRSISPRPVPSLAATQKSVLKPLQRGPPPRPLPLFPSCSLEP